MIKKFNEYINEGLRDKMTGISDDDVYKKLSGLNTINKIDVVIKNKINKKFFPPQEELDIFYQNRLNMAIKAFKKENDFLKDISFEFYPKKNKPYKEAKSKISKEQAEKLGVPIPWWVKETEVEFFLNAHIKNYYADKIEFWHYAYNINTGEKMNPLSQIIRSYYL